MKLKMKGTINRGLSLWRLIAVHRVNWRALLRLSEDFEDQPFSSPFSAWSSCVDDKLNAEISLASELQKLLETDRSDETAIKERKKNQNKQSQIYENKLTIFLCEHK